MTTKCLNKEACSLITLLTSFIWKSKIIKLCACKSQKKGPAFWTLGSLLPFIVKSQFVPRINSQPSAGTYPKIYPPSHPFSVIEFYTVMPPLISQLHKPLTCRKRRTLVFVSSSSNWPFSTVTLSPSCGTLSGNQLWALDHLRQNWKEKFSWKTVLMLYFVWFKAR